MAFENRPFTFSLSNFPFIDPNSSPANTLAAVKISTLPSTGTLTDNNVPVTAMQFVSLADINAGLLVYTPATNAAGPGVASFTFQVQDTGSTLNGGANLDPVAKTMTINVTPIGSAPVGASNTVGTLQTVPYSFLVSDFRFTDPNDSPANTFTAVEITTLPGSGTLNDNNIPVTAGQFVSVADITAGKLTYTAATPLNGTSPSFTFQVQDDGSTANGGANIDASLKTMTVNVTGVSHTPSGRRISLQLPSILLHDYGTEFRIHGSQ